MNQLQPPHACPAQTAAFVELGLPVGAWMALYPLPLVWALRQDAQERPTLYRNTPPTAHTEYLVETACDLWAELTCPANGHLGAADPACVQQFLTELNHLPEEPMATKIKRGTDLLAWHLAKDFDCVGRDRFLERLRFSGVRLIAMDPFRIIPQTLEALRERIDAYLPLSDYAPDYQHPEPSVEIPHNLHALWIVPVVRLLIKDGSISSVDELIHQTKYGLLQWEYPERGVSCWLLQTEWERLLQTLDIAQTDAWLARWEPLFIEQLAQLPYARRQESLRWLSDTLCRVHRLPECEAYFQQLRRRIDTLRRVGRPSPPDPQPAQSHAPVDATQPTSPSPPAMTAAPHPATSPAIDAAHSMADQSPTPPFIPLTWAEALARAEAFPAECWEPACHAPLLFEPYRLESGPVVVVPADAELPRSLWFVGDLHGDLLAAVNAWEYIQHRAQAAGQRPARRLFGRLHRPRRASPRTASVSAQPRLPVSRPSHLPRRQPRRRLALRRRCRTVRQPCRTGRIRRPTQCVVGCGQRPRRAGCGWGIWPSAGLLVCHGRCSYPMATIVAHAGVPHTDRLAELHRPDDLTRSPMLQDFVWLRLSPNLPRKRPNRSTRGCEFGYADLADFCAHVEQLNIPAKRLVRGHDHLPQRYATYPKYQATPVLTLNSMCRRLENEPFAPLVAPVCVAEYVPGQLPRVHPLRLAEEQVRLAFPAHWANEPAIPAPVQD
jgi:hypothetical protein